MTKIRFRLYPEGQIRRYLIIDIVLCVFLFYNVLSAGSPVGLFGTLLLLALFLVLFYMGLWFRGWRLLAVVVAGCGLMTVFAIYYEPWILLFAVAFADFLGRVRTREQLAAGLAALAAIYPVTSHVVYRDALHFLQTPLLPFLIIQLVVPFVVRTLERSESLKSELAAARERIAHYVQEEERHRLARDLHDTLGQTMTMIKVKSELAMRMMEKDPPRAKREMQEVIRTSRLALKQVRDLVTDMRYVSLEQELELGQSLLASAGIQFDFRRAERRPDLSKITETMLALALRESLTNAVKHSGAQRCTVTERFADGWYRLDIEDDGIGMTGAQKTEGHGLAAMEERMRLLRGEARVGPSSLGGVRVTLAVPVSVPSADGEDVP